jgi:hypothetical protein
LAFLVEAFSVKQTVDKIKKAAMRTPESVVADSKRCLKFQATFFLSLRADHLNGALQLCG